MHRLLYRFSSFCMWFFFHFFPFLFSLATANAINFFLLLYSCFFFFCCYTNCCCCWCFCHWFLFHLIERRFKTCIFLCVFLSLFYLQIINNLCNRIDRKMRTKYINAQNGKSNAYETNTKGGVYFLSIYPRTFAIYPSVSQWIRISSSYLNNIDIGNIISMPFFKTAVLQDLPHPILCVGIHLHLDINWGIRMQISIEIRF